MTIRDNRSMNADLQIGAVEGKMRFMRPATGSADEGPTQTRALALDTTYYGNLGLSYEDKFHIDAMQPTGAKPFPPYMGE